MSKYVIIEKIHSTNPQLVLVSTTITRQTKIFSNKKLAEEVASHYQDAKVIEL